jgi:hypothetical protein
MPHPSIANPRLHIHHSFTLVSDPTTIIDHLRAYWESRSFNLTEDDDGSMSGTRGSYIANFTSFDSTKLISSIALQCSDTGNVTTTMVVDLSGQILTSWNRLDLELEQVLCQRSFTGLPTPPSLRTYKQSQAKSNVLWVLTFGLTTHLMPTSWRNLLDEVNPSANNPVLRHLEPGAY